MNQPPEPRPGFYIATSCGTRYEATKHPKTGWWLQKMSGQKGRPPTPYQKPDFPANVLAKIFIPEQP